MQSIENWFSAGERIKISLDAQAQRGATKDRHIFCRMKGKGTWLTFLHGFPTCSWDWAKIADKIEAKHRVLMFDFLGFGDSDKPRDHQYSIFEQADITEALWRHFGIANTGLVAHDYGDTVALELLSRQSEQRLSVRIEKVAMLNGGIYVNYQRPLLIQKLLRKPFLGALISSFLRERSFTRRFASIFSKSHPPSDSELTEHWQAVQRRNGKRNYPNISRYLTERRQHRSRWEKALESCETPIRFLWGSQDPVSGKNISGQIRERLPQADLLEMEDVGHYPQLEVPRLVAEEILKMFK